MTMTHDTTLPEVSELDRPIWGARAIGQVSALNERQAYYLLENGRLDGTKIGSQWVSTQRRICRSLGIGA